MAEKDYVLKTKLFTILILLILSISSAYASKSDGSIHNLNKCLKKNGFNYQFITDETKKIIKRKCVKKNQVKLDKETVIFQADPLTANISNPKGTNGFHLTISSYYNPDPKLIITALEAVVTYRNTENIEYNHILKLENLWIEPYKNKKHLYMGWFENVREHFSKKTQVDYCKPNNNKHCKTWNLSGLWGIKILIN